jgi:hypothetical protein
MSGLAGSCREHSGAAHVTDERRRVGVVSGLPSSAEGAL